MIDLRSGLAVTLALTLPACGSADDPDLPAATPTASAPEAVVAAPTPAGYGSDGVWTLESSDMGVALALLRSQDVEMMRLVCPTGKAQLIVNVPDFAPEAGQAQLALAGKGATATFAVSPAIVSPQGGVSASGGIPAGLAALMSDTISATYGSRKGGPYVAPPEALATSFVAGCTGAPRLARKPAEPVPPVAPAVTAAMAPAAPAPQAPPAPQAVALPKSISPCMVQGAEQLAVRPFRAGGTEPFWSAKIEGRCVTYSQPSDQKGTRVWTRYTRGPDGESWVGALNGKPFELRTRPARACSDGMSDRRHPLSAEVIVGGGRRTGCGGPS